MKKISIYPTTRYIYEKIKHIKGVVFVRNVKNISQGVICIDIAKVFLINWKEWEDKLVVFVVYCHNKKECIDKIIGNGSIIDYFSSDTSPEELEFKFEKAKTVLLLKEDVILRERKIDSLKGRDYATGCFNPLYFINQLPVLLSAAANKKISVSFIGLDIDFLRQINELYGVEFANSIINRILELVRSAIPKGAFIVRWRGDNFFIVVPKLSKDKAIALAEKIRRRVARHKFSYKGQVTTITLSMGVVSYPRDGEFMPREVIDSLEKVIDISKHRGGNTVTSLEYNSKIDDQEFVTEDNINILRRRLQYIYREHRQSIYEMIYGFAKAIESRDSDTGIHVEKTALIARKVAKKLRLSAEEIENIVHAAILHDLGKIGIEEKILHKRGKLTKSEKEVIKAHPWIGAEILRDIRVLRGAINAILYHHERWDGRGYPLGLKGEEIPIGARIVAVADVYEALTSDRPYRKAYSKKKALEIIKAGRGKQFDPVVVDIFLEIVRQI